MKNKAEQKQEAFPEWRRKVDLVYRASCAVAFRLTGRAKFVQNYGDSLDLLLSCNELLAIAARVRGRRGSLLVFGAGNDSLLWTVLNFGRPTIILESDPVWLRDIQRQSRFIPLGFVTYTSRLSDVTPPSEPMEKPDRMELPPEINARRWKSILIDAPQGWGDGPGRAQSLLEAVHLVADDGLIFLHDCDRQGEQWLIARYLRDWPSEQLTARLRCFRKPAP